MNKEQLQTRIQLINQDIEAQKNNIVILQGHLAEAMHWMSEILKQEKCLQDAAPSETCFPVVTETVEEAVLSECEYAA